LLHVEAFGSARDVTLFGRHREIPQTSEFHCHTQSVSISRNQHHI
jgi:hypothetical protein